MKKHWARKRKAEPMALLAALVVAALVIGVFSFVLGPKSTSPGHPGFDLTSSVSSFTITAMTYTTPSGAYPSNSCSGTPALLYPGVTRCVVFSIHNNLKATISVKSITSSLDPAFSAPPLATCTGTYLTLPAFSGSFNVASGATVSSPGVPIVLKDSGTNQSACENYAYHFLYSGTAQYTEIYGTSTAVTSSQNPSTVGNAVTYTATVTATATASQDPVPSSPTGSVTFYDGTVSLANVIPGCSGVGAASATTTTAKATCASPVYATLGTHSITAVYSNSDGNFAGSTSPAVTQTVNLATSTVTLTSSPNPSTFGQSVIFSAQTTPASGPTGRISFYQCTTAACTSTFQLGTGPLNATGKATFATSALAGGTEYLRAVYGGDTHYAPATSNVVTQTVNFTKPCIVTTIKGGYTVKSGKSICISSPGRVNGGVTVQSGGSLVLNGATINGNITATSANALRFCGSTINGNITATGTTGYIVIGDGGDDGPPGCAANNITGKVTLSGSKGGFEIAANKVVGTVTLSANTGAGPTSEDAAPEVEGNNITGSLSCATSNSPALTDGGQKNTVSGSKTGQCSAAGF